MVRLLEVQMVDGKKVEAGEVISADTATETALVAHGKAEFVVVEEKELPGIYVEEKKGK